MRFGVIADPDVTRAYADALAGAGCEPVPGALERVDAVVIAGALEAALVDAVAALAAAGTPVLGLGDGFAALCGAGLLDGGLEPAPAAALSCRVEGRPTPFTGAIPVGRELHLGTARHCYHHPDLTALEAEARVVLRVAGAGGELGGDVAAVCNPAGNVVGVVAFADPQLYRAAIAWHRGTPARVG